MHPLLQGKNNISVKVIPRAKKTEIIGLMDDGNIKIRLQAVPEDGKANLELLNLLEDDTGAQWEIVSGYMTTRK